MFTFDLTNKKTYAEMDQVNPLRWKILFKDGNVFTDQSGWLKCKDFFNDVVAFLQAGKAFQVYRFDNQVKANKEGIYLLLNYVTKEFQDNLKVLNEQLEKDLDVKIEVVHHKDSKSLVILIPTPLWTSTYLISLVSLCIRLCNYGVVYQQWSDFWANGSPARTFEKILTNRPRDSGFTLPQTHQKYWYFCGAYNSESTYQISAGVIHNNGMVNWDSYLPKGV